MTRFVPTPEQQAIIAYPFVPLRVAAGAGTGKTTTIVERLAAAVARGGDPTRALGVTFTNKAADELRSKLRDAVGVRQDGREVEVATYHSFASSILDEFGAFVGYEPSATLMDEGHRSELAFRVLRELETTDLDLSSLPTRRDEMLTVSEALASNLADVDVLLGLAPSQPDKVWMKRVSLVRAADRFADAKLQRGFLEYSDLIRLAVNIVEEFPDIAKRIGQRYDTILLDEYQDTDPAQRRLLTAIFGHGAAVTAVGDADQTIYEWRGASLENFAEFPNHFPPVDGQATETLPLSVNRRSDEMILHLANDVQALLPRLDGSKPLTPGPDAARGMISVGWLATDAEEASWISSRITRYREAGRDWSDMAILCRKRSAIPSIVNQLRDDDIPYSVSSMGELLTVPEVADLLSWLRVLADPGDETSLLRIWMGGLFRIGMRDISRLERWCTHGDLSDLGTALEHLDDIEGLSPDGRRRFERYFSIHADLHTRSQVLSVPAIVTLTIEHLGLWDEVAALSPGIAATARVNIGRFTAITNMWKPLDGIPTLDAFLRYIDALDNARDADELEAAADLSDSVVQVITAHSAKGLEWPVVFLPALADGTFPSGVATYDDPDNIATALPYELRLDRASFTEASKAGQGKERRNILKARHVDAEWRLAYVAVTRAKNELVMTGHAWDKDVKRPRTPSRLLLMGSEVAGATLGPWATDPGPKPEPAAYVEAPEPPDPHFEGDWASALRNRVHDPAWIVDRHPDIAAAVQERSDQLIMKIADLAVPEARDPVVAFSTSVTNLVALAECPLKFKWIHHDRLPRRPGLAAKLGTEFHRKVELHNLGVIALDDPSPEAFDDVTYQHDANLVKYVDPWVAFEGSRFLSMRTLFAEVPFVVEIGHGTLRGKIDAIYQDDDGAWEIVDYKSGRRSQDDARRVQLQAYALAVTDGAVTLDAPRDMAVTFAYFGGGVCEEVTSVVDERWLDEARITVEALMGTAESGPFEPAPSLACRYCDFLHLCPAGRTELRT